MTRLPPLGSALPVQTVDIYELPEGGSLADDEGEPDKTTVDAVAIPRW